MWAVCPSWEEGLPYKCLLQVSTPPVSSLKRNLLIHHCIIEVNMVTVVRLPNSAVPAVRRIAKEVVVDKQSELAKHVILKTIKKVNTDMIKFAGAPHVASLLML